MPPATRGPPIIPAPATAKSEGKPEPLIASAFLLDFLYPSGAAALLRRIQPALFRRVEPHQSTQQPTAHLHTSSIARARRGRRNDDKTRAWEEDEDLELEEEEEEELEEDEDGAVSNDQSPATNEEVNLPQEPVEEEPVFKAWLSATNDQEMLQELLKDVLDPDYGMVWEVFHRLEPALKDDFKANVLLFLARSQQVTEASHICELFTYFEVEEWTENVVHAAVRAYLKVQNYDTALSVFETALDQKRFGQALDAFVAYDTNREQWDLMLKAWTLYTSHQGANPPRFKDLSTLPNLSTKLHGIFENIKKRRKTDELDLLQNLFKHIARTSLSIFGPQTVVQIIEFTNDSAAYEAFIMQCLDSDRSRLAGDLYKKYRRSLNNVVSQKVLWRMLAHFYPKDDQGLKQVYTDYKQRSDTYTKGILPLTVYQKFMAHHGRKGDIKTVRRLAEEYLRYHERAKRDESVIACIMQAHAVNANPDAARKAMEEGEERTGMKANIYHWNILLNAHAKAADYTGAIETFSRLCDEGEPDGYSFGTLMGMAAIRGDLSFTIELFNLATREKKIKPDLAMVDCIVEAYCQNDRFQEAEKLCLNMMKNRDIKGPHTILWNTLLHHHALQRDLSSVNRILEFMASKQIPYDDDTYSQLLTVLMYVGQSHHAMHLLRLAQKDGLFRPTPEHFVILMAAFIRSNEPHMAIKLNRILHKQGNAGNPERWTYVINALRMWKKIPSSKRWDKTAKDFLIKALEKFQQSVRLKESGVHVGRKIMHAQYSHITSILTELRDFGSLQDIIDVYHSQYPAEITRENMPLRLLTSIMHADFYERNYESVRKTWQVIIDRTLKRNILSPSAEQGSEEVADVDADADISSPTVLGRMRFGLSAPIKVIQRLYLAEKDAAGLMAMMDQVQARGFKLDSKNWNMYVFILARLHEYVHAFRICEEQLMPQWTGWAHERIKKRMRRQLPLEIRRMNHNPHRPRPITHTLLYLARAYMDLEQAAPWSNESGRILREINEKAPMTVTAVTSVSGVMSGEVANILGLTSNLPSEPNGGRGSGDFEAEGKKLRLRKKKKRSEREKRRLERQQQRGGEDIEQVMDEDMEQMMDEEASMVEALTKGAVR